MYYSAYQPQLQCHQKIKGIKSIKFERVGLLELAHLQMNLSYQTSYYFFLIFFQRQDSQTNLLTSVEIVHL